MMSSGPPESHNEVVGVTRFALTLSLLAFVSTLTAAELPAPIGTRIGDFSLPEPAAAKTWASSDLPRDGKATVVIFMATGCPVNSAYLPKLTQLHKRFSPDGVTFIGINSHPADDAARVAQHAKDNAIPFTVLKDTDGKIAERFNVERVPTAFVLDGAKMVRYKGRIDDQFAPNAHKLKATTSELFTAINAVVEGRDVKTPFVESAGCKLSSTKPTATTTVTYHKEIARIIQAKCQECHRPGEAAPFTLMTFKDAKAWSAMIREVVADGVMPPWHATAKIGHFINDRRLEDDQKKTLLTWIDAGCPEGDANETPQPKTYKTGWRLGREPDLIVKMNKAVSVPAQFMYGLGMPYQHVFGDHEFTEDTWIQALEVRPEYRAAIHHIIVYIIPPGAEPRKLLKDELFSRHMLGAFVPGDEAAIYPEGMAKLIPKGSKLLYELHYTPNGKAGTDQSAVGLLVAKTPPKYEVKTDSAINRRFSIPAGESNYSPDIAVLPITKPMTLLSMTPHMHLRGKAFKYELVSPNGDRELLLDVPKYDFNWQVPYALTKFRDIPAGSTIECTAWYDNSKANPSNPDPTKTVRWGQQTWEEMMIGFVEYYVER